MGKYWKAFENKASNPLKFFHRNDWRAVYQERNLSIEGLAKPRGSTKNK
ncbi:MAG: hypothetical protein VSS75_003915 [Candidatus Parabeggiatoa sp.]|nr:hypothetical protein [Candidatus Parabeggiatoa sp.]